MTIPYFEKINILIIEDNEDDLYFIRKALTEEKYRLHAISSGTEAFNYLQNPKVIPDVVLLDNHLPGINGIEILNKLNNNKNDYAFIFLTVDSSIKTVVKAMNSGALDFIVKSANLKNELIEKIEKVFKIHRNKIETLEAKANFESLIESGSDSIWSIDKNYKLNIFNQYYKMNFKKAFGLEIKKGDDAIQILPDELKPIWKAKFDEALIGERVVFENSSILDKEKMYFEVRLNPIVLNNNIVGVSAISRNITVRKKSELKLIEQNDEYETLNEELIETNKKLKKAKEKAEEGDHLKTEFLNNMSHEIRTPLNGILGFTEILKKPDKSEEKRKHYISIIQNSGNQLMRIIDDILEISKLETKQIDVNYNSVCLNDILLELFSVFDIKAKENKTPLYLKKGLSDYESNIYSDRQKLTRILSNLLENSISFTNEGFIEFGYNLIKNEIEFYVKDTGIGIELDKQELIFKRFSQEDTGLSKKAGGLGLGLSIAKENAELLDGKINLESEKGKGALFTLTIPYKPVNIEKKQRPISNKNNGIEESAYKHTILIAEDEEVNYLYLETLLNDEFELNCDIIHAKNGLEAIDICKENQSINFVLMDLKMNVLNGYEATKRIKKILPNLPIIAQTAYSTKSDKEKALQAGCDDFISKPISEETLKNIINNYLIKKS